MPTHAELCAKLLNDAAEFFRILGDQNSSITEQMAENARVFEQMAALIVQQPSGVLDGDTHGSLAGRLLAEAGTFFRSLAEQNPPIKDQMLQNADIYEQMAKLITTDPAGVVDESQL